MRIEIISKLNGTSTYAEAATVTLRDPSVVRLPLRRDQIASVTRQGDDLIITTTDGQLLRIVQFYHDAGQVESDAVVTEGDQHWLVHPGQGIDADTFSLIGDLDALTGGAAAAGGSSLTVPLALGGLAAVGGGIALMSGGGSDAPRSAAPAADNIPPSAPVVTVRADGGAVTGTGEPGATVQVRDANGAVIGTGTVDAQGNVTVPLTTPQANGQTISVTQTDPSGNVSPATTISAPDTIPPAAPAGQVSADGTILSGTGEAGATVTVRNAAGAAIGSAVVAANGSYSIALSPAAANGGTITVVQTDAAGNRSPETNVAAPDITPPAAPLVSINDDGTIVSGSGEPGARVTVTGATSNVIGSGTVAVDGAITVVLIPPASNGGAIAVVQSDAAGNPSPSVTLTAPDTMPPEAPVVTLAGDGASAQVTGEAGATVTVTGPGGGVIGQATIGSDGSATVPLSPAAANGGTVTAVQTDAAGNVSDPVTLTAPDITPPAPPAPTLDASGAVVSGTGEAGAAIAIRDANGALLGSGSVDARGLFAVTLATPQIDRQTLTVVQTDAAGNASPAVTLVAPDLTAPAPPVAAVAPDGTTVTGTAEAGATVTITDPLGQVIAVIPNNPGSFTVALVPPLVDGERLAVTQRDAAGNLSPTTIAIAPDLVVGDHPDAPVASVSPDGAAVTGTAGANATITVRDSAGAIIATGAAAADGSYTVALTPPRIDGAIVHVTQSDTLGRESPPTDALTPDLTAPAAPTAAIDGTGTIVTGTAEAGATVRVTGAAGGVLGVAVAGANGAYAVTLTPPQANGETLGVVQVDQAGNPSAAIPLTAPDITAPAAPVASVAGDGLSVAGTGEAGATVTVRDTAGAVLGTALVAGDGSFAVALSPARIDGAPLTVTQRDGAGNTSLATQILTPDNTPPAAPVVVLSGDGATITGTGEAGAIVTIRDPQGTAIATTTIAANGTFSATLTPARIDGETLSVTQADAAGNLSPATNVVAPDLTTLPAPTAAISGDGGTVTGTGVAGATVTIRDAAGASLGSALVAADGSYTAALSPAQANGETLTAQQATSAGAISPTISLSAPDITPPALPTATVDATGTTITGSGEPGATVRVSDANGGPLGVALVGADGSYSVPLAPAQANGQALTVVQVDPAGNSSQAVPLTAPDITAPAAPTLALAADGVTVSGSGEAGAIVTITGANGATIGTANVGADGTYTATLGTPLRNGEALSATQRDATGNISAPVTITAADSTPPAAPIANVTANGTIIAGTGEPGARLVVTDAAGMTAAVAIVAADGSFTAPLNPPLRNGETLTAVQTDAAGNPSPAIAIVAPDTTAPLTPIGSVAANGASLSGTGEAGARVTVRDAQGATIGSATVAADGSFTAPLQPAQANGQSLTLSQSDAAGNTSPTVTVAAPDITAPALPTGAIAGDGVTVTGTGEPNARIEVRDAQGNALGTATVASDGSYIINLAQPQRNGEALTVVQLDAASNISPALPLTAPDTTPPTAPVVSITGDGATISGTGEAGATLSVTGPGGQPLGSVVVASDGSFSLPLTTAQANGQALTVRQVDGTGNISPAANLTAPDITAPAAPIAFIAADGTRVTGSGEAGATVTVIGAGGQALGSALVAANGSYSVVLTTPQTNGEALQVVQTDPAQNPSPPAIVVAPDGTAPPAPIASISADGTTVDGTGVSGSTIIVRDATGASLGTALVDGNGVFLVTLTTPQRDGELLEVRQADGSGNLSLPVPLVAPDLTAPVGLTASVAPDGTIVTGSGEVGATVTVSTAGGVALGSAVVGANGSYVVTLTPAQANGEALSAAQRDPAGNLGTPLALLAPDITPPAAPTNLAVSANGATLTGNGEANADVEVRDTGGTVIGRGVVAGDGSFAITLGQAQLTGATLSVVQADQAGNRSPGSTIVAPFDISAFDNNDSAAITLLPVGTTVNAGSAGYVALVSVGALDLQAQVLTIPNVAFTVREGHQFDASFTYGATVDIGVGSNYSVVVQRFDGANWVAVSGTGEASILDVGLLNGDLVAQETLPPGSYRAFVTFQGVGVGVLGSLTVGGTDLDYTDIGSVQAETVSGNVITDPGPAGAVDIVSPQTQVSSITVNGVSTALVADGTSVQGNWGTLVINLDGSYSYTPAAAASAIGQTDSFTYTLIDRSDGELESATLSIAIGSPAITGAPLALDDSAIARVSYQNVTATFAPVAEFSFVSPAAVLAPRTGSGGNSFTVATRTTADVTLYANSTSAGLLPAVLTSYTFTVRDAGGNVVSNVTRSGLLGSTASLTLDDLPAGTYTYTVSNSNSLGTGYTTNVTLGETVTYLDRYQLSGATIAQGDLLANDDPHTSFAAIRVDQGSGFAEIGDTPVTLAGRYGTLTIDELGQYTYQPSATLAYSATDLTDSFTYQLLQPNGTIATAALNIIVDVPADGVAVAAAGPAMTSMSLAPSDEVPILETLLAAAPEQAPHLNTQDTVPAGYTLFEGQGTIEEVLGNYLDQNGNNNGGSSTDMVKEVDSAKMIPLNSASPDSLSYLVTSDNDEHHRLSTMPQQ